MEFTYESQGRNTFLVYEIENDDVIDSLGLGMLTNNRIIGFVPTFFTQMDDKRFIKYNVSAKVSARQFFEGIVNKKRLIGVFEGIVNGLLTAEEYMIDPNFIVLDLDYIFADVSTCEAMLVCLPIMKKENNGSDISLFFKNIMFSTQFDQSENCDHVAKIINFLNSSPSLSLTKFSALLNDIKLSSDKVNAVTVIPARKPEVTVNGSATTATVPVVRQEAVPVQPSVQPVPNILPKEPVIPATKTAIKQQTIPEPAPQKKSDEKSMSLFYLMQHYNKENAEIYKSQKSNKKVKKEAAAPKSSEKKKKTKIAPAPSNHTPGFAIPGQAAPMPKAEQTPVQQPKNIAPAPKPVQPISSAPVQQPAYVPRPMPQESTLNFGETVVLGGGAVGETTVLNGSTQTLAQISNPHLIRDKNNEKIPLNKPVFRVGKERSYVDYFIGDNTAISRSHANFITRDGAYFVMDTNSTNHTFVNGVVIQSNTEVKISHGDRIRMANEDFEFRVY